MKAVNKNRVIIKLNSKECLVVERIVVPKFYINDIEFNEYDLRNLQSEVALGNVSHELLNSMNIVDAKGGKFIFREDGALVNSPFGYDTMSRAVINLFRTRKDNEDRVKNTKKITLCVNLFYLIFNNLDSLLKINLEII